MHFKVSAADFTSLKKASLTINGRVTNKDKKISAISINKICVTKKFMAPFKTLH